MVTGQNTISCSQQDQSNTGSFDHMVKRMKYELGHGRIYLLNQELPMEKTYCITANTDIGVVVWRISFLRLLQTQQPISKLNIVSAPKIKVADT